MATVPIRNKEYPYILKEEYNIPKNRQTIWWYKIADLETQYALADEIEFEADPENENELRTIYRPNKKTRRKLSGRVWLG